MTSATPTLSAGQPGPARLQGRALTDAARTFDRELLARGCSTGEPLLLDAVADAFARFCSELPDGVPDLLTAWNAFAEASAHLRVVPGRCHECHGRRWSGRSLGAGSQACLTCGGTGRGDLTSVRTFALTVPAAA